MKHSNYEKVPQLTRADKFLAIRAEMNKSSFAPQANANAPQPQEMAALELAVIAPHDISEITETKLEHDLLSAETFVTTYLSEDSTPTLKGALKRIYDLYLRALTIEDWDDPLKDEIFLDDFAPLLTRDERKTARLYRDFLVLKSEKNHKFIAESVTVGRHALSMVGTLLK
jgi:hypothetical protein